MTRPLVLVLESSQLQVVPASGSPFTVPWTASDPETAARAVAERAGAPASVVIVVGLAFLEITRATLPPVGRAEQLQMLRHAPDRYFALSGAAAVATEGPVAFALESTQLTQWVRAFSVLGPVAGVLTIAQAAVWTGASGVVTLDAGHDAQGALTIEDGQLCDARRMRRANGADGAPVDSVLQVQQLLDGAPLDVIASARAAARVLDASLDMQLLDAPLHAQMQRARRRGDWRTVAVIVAAALLLMAALDWRAQRQLVALEREVQRLEPLAVPARDAQSRWQRATEEVERLQQIATLAASPNAPDAVLARVSARLPADAFVQRLSWDGAVWRLDGSARDAAALVPLLSADSTLREVQSAAPSTRYLDGGVTRSSFSLTFTTAGGVNGAR